MKNIAIIPARSGSKGLKDKNIKKLDGIPLLVYSIIAAKESNLFDEIMVSTDSIEYAQIAKKYGSTVPFLRSSKNSEDNSSSWDVVKEVLFEYLKKGIKFDSICLLQPTSPLRRSDDIIGAYQEMLNNNVDSVTSVCEMDHSPLWATTLDDTKSLKNLRKKLSDLPRQSLQTYYRINGALYIRKINYNGNVIELMNNTEIAYIMDRKYSVDIDNLEDFEYASFLIKRIKSNYKDIHS